MKLKDKVVEALKADAESGSGFLSGFSKLDLRFHDSFVAIDGEIEGRSPHGERGLKYCGERSARSPVTLACRTGTSWPQAGGTVRRCSTITTCPVAG